MEKLQTIQTRENLNSIYKEGEIGPGGARHVYVITDAKNQVILETIMFQKGPRKDPESTFGVLDSDLLEIVRDRLKSFQDGPMANEYNARALQSVEEALYQMNLRVENRIERGVLGTMEK